VPPLKRMRGSSNAYVTSTMRFSTITVSAIMKTAPARAYADDEDGCSRGDAAESTGPSMHSRFSLPSISTTHP